MRFFATIFFVAKLMLSNSFWKTFLAKHGLWKFKFTILIALNGVKNSFAGRTKRFQGLRVGHSCTILSATVKPLIQSASENGKILLSGRNFLFCFFLQLILKLNEDAQKMSLLKTLFNLPNSINSAN